MVGKFTMKKGDKTKLASYLIYHGTKTEGDDYHIGSLPGHWSMTSSRQHKIHMMDVAALTHHRVWLMVVFVAS